jgi:hypothetical protein
VKTRPATNSVDSLAPHFAVIKAFVDDGSAIATAIATSAIATVTVDADAGVRFVCPSSYVNSRHL